MRDGLITAILNDLGTYPEISELFITLSNVSLNNDSACLRSFVELSEFPSIDFCQCFYHPFSGCAEDTEPS